MRNRLAALIQACSLAIVPSASAAPFTVIVNAGVRGKTITKETLTQVFLGRIERWADGRPISPVDLSVTSEVRKAFSQDALGMSVLNVRGQWLRAISAGHMPPLTRATDEEVIAFVAASAGGIGYVAEGAVLPATVKVIVVE
jgi:ABC-type phosphate transport system substrate-binding protein